MNLQSPDGNLGCRDVGIGVAVGTAHLVTCHMVKVVARNYFLYRVLKLIKVQKMVQIRLCLRVKRIEKIVARRYPEYYHLFATHSSADIVKKLSEVGPTFEGRKGLIDDSSEGLTVKANPILMPSQDSRLPVGTIRSEVGSQRSCVDQITATPHEIKSLTSGSEVGNSTLQGKAASFHVPFSILKPSSNYNDRPQQAIGPQKAIGSSME